MTLYCGIDLHSNNVMVSVIDEQDQVIYERRLGNDLAQIVLSLAPYREALGGVVVESTYNWYWLVDGLLEAGFDVRLANPLAVKQYDGLKYTNDATDARFLAHLLRLGILPEGYIYPRAARGVRDLLRRRLLLVQQRTMQHLSLQSLLARHTGQRLTSSQVKQLDADKLGGLLKADAVLLSACVALDLIHTLTTAIGRVEQAVGAACLSTRPYALVSSVRGIGPILGQTIVLETGPIERFAGVGDYASYCRCVPSRKLSNGKKKGEGNANNGNKYLELAFVEAAHYAAIWEPKVKRYYQRKCAKTHVMVAKKAVANKLAKACFYMLTRNELFDVNRAFA